MGGSRRVAILMSMLVPLGACAAQGSTGGDAGLGGGVSPDASKHVVHDAGVSLGDALVVVHDAVALDFDGGKPEASAPVDAAVDSAPPAKDAHVDSAPPCVPTTCAAAMIACGPLANGCGATIDCGGCTLPDTCGGGGMDGTCGCTKATCASAAAACGSLSDGCGGTLACGACTYPETCGTAGTCGAPCGTLVGGSTLAPGDHLASCDGRFSLDMQATDGNLVLYFAGSALWSSKTGGNAGASASMQTDGNFVVYSSAATALWSSGTGGNPGAFVSMQSDGNLVVYSASQAALWSSGTCCH